MAAGMISQVSAGAAPTVATELITKTALYTAAETCYVYDWACAFSSLSPFFWAYTGIGLRGHAVQCE